MREMKSAPEKIVMLEVAMVRLVKPELDASIEALDERVTRLERAACVAPPRRRPGTGAPTDRLDPAGASASQRRANTARHARTVGVAPPDVRSPYPRRRSGTPVDLEEVRRDSWNGHPARRGRRSCC